MKRSLWQQTVKLCARSIKINTRFVADYGSKVYFSNYTIPVVSCLNRRHRHHHQQQQQQRRGLSPGKSTEQIFKSPMPDKDFPEVTLSDYMFSRFEKFGDTLAMFDDVTGNSYTYSELRPLAEKIGSYLTRHGLRKNDVICYYGTNHPEFTLLLLACLSIGVILTPANSAFTAGELKTQMTQSEARTIVTVPTLVPTAQKAGISNENIIVIGEADGCVPFSKMLEDDGKGMPPNIVINPREDVAILPYSSGTTGLPKGVMLTHYNIVSNLIQLKDVLITVESDINFGLLPFFHIYGLAIVNLSTLQGGGRVVTTTGFEPEKFLTGLQKHKVTKLHIVPPIVLFLARHPVVSKFDLSSITEVVCAAAPLSENLIDEFQERLNIPLKQGYGLTETSPGVAIDTIPAKQGTVGKLICNTEAKVVDTESGKSLIKCEKGELVIRGPQNMKGYLKNEAATRQMIDKDGWLYTGDMAYFTDDEYLVICDRLKELIKYKGQQVAPAELENIIHQHPGVQDVAVMGIQDEGAGEVPKAFVVVKPDANVTEQVIQNFVQDKVADYKKLRGGVEFIKEIPKSPSGKILRRLLKNRS